MAEGIALLTCITRFLVRVSTQAMTGLTFFCGCLYSDQVNARIVT